MDYLRDGMQKRFRGTANISHMARISTIFSQTTHKQGLDHPYDVSAAQRIAHELSCHPYVNDLLYYPTLLPQTSSRWDDVKCICEGIVRNNIRSE